MTEFRIRDTLLKVTKGDITRNLRKKSLQRQ